MFLKKFLFLILLCFLIVVASGIEITSNITESSIEWNYTEVTNIQNASIDGVMIEGFNPFIGVYLLTGLKENESHSFTIYTNNSYYTNITNTSFAKDTEIEKTFGSINLYIFFFIALGCLLISAFVKPVAWLALLFSLFGILMSLNDNFNMALIYVTITLLSIVSLGYE